MIASYALTKEEQYGAMDRALAIGIGVVVALAIGVALGWAVGIICGVAVGTVMLVVVQQS